MPGTRNAPRLCPALPVIELHDRRRQSRRRRIAPAISPASAVPNGAVDVARSAGDCTDERAAVVERFEAARCHRRAAVSGTGADSSRRRVPAPRAAVARRSGGVDCRLLARPQQIRPSHQIVDRRQADRCQPCPHVLGDELKIRSTASRACRRSAVADRSRCVAMPTGQVLSVTLPRHDAADAPPAPPCRSRIPRRRAPRRWRCRAPS